MIALILIDGHGHELVLNLYIPLDFSIVICKTCFYFYIHYEESTKKKDAKRLARKFKTYKKQEAGNKEPLLGMTKSELSNASQLSDMTSNASA